MHKLIRRNIEPFVLRNLKVFPVVAILGPRQCGKTTLVKMLSNQIKNFLYLDLQNYDDLNKLSEPTLFFEANENATVCLDEIQLLPQIFSHLRSIIDKNRRNGRFIILGSASRELIQSSSESLAGRIGFVYLSPFLINELNYLSDYSLNRYWLRGGFPNSYYAENDFDSMLWIDNFIQTFIERDIPQFGFQIPSLQLKRLIQMCAHNQGQILNSSKLGESLGLSHPTVRRYIDLFEQVLILRTLNPYFSNIKKRLIKSPKVYIRDTGLLHRLLRIDSFNSLLGNPIFGSSWEGLVIENIITNFPDSDFCYYRTSTGDEIDLVFEKGNKKIAIEAKASTAPQLTKGFWNSISDLKPDISYVVAPVKDTYNIKENVVVTSLDYVIKSLNEV